MRFKLRDELTVEDLGEEFLVCDADQAIVHRVTATNAPWLADLMSGIAIDVDESVVHELVAAGLLETVEDEPATSSRRLVLGIAVAATAAVGLTSLVLPSAAAASSGGAPTTVPPTVPPTFPPTTPTTVPPTPPTTVPPTVPPTTPTTFLPPPP